MLISPKNKLGELITWYLSAHAVCTIQKRKVIQMRRKKEVLTLHDCPDLVSPLRSNLSTYGWLAAAVRSFVHPSVSQTDRQTDRQTLLRGGVLSVPVKTRLHQADKNFVTYFWRDKYHRKPWVAGCHSCAGKMSQMTLTLSVWYCTCESDRPHKWGWMTDPTFLTSKILLRFALGNSPTSSAGSFCEKRSSLTSHALNLGVTTSIWPLYAYLKTNPSCLCPHSCPAGLQSLSSSVVLVLTAPDAIQLG